MGVNSRYWRIVKIDTSGQKQIQEITPARKFFNDVFSIPDDHDDHHVPDRLIQSKLLDLSLNEPADICLLAERCLLCFTSWQIEQACLQLVDAYGTVHGFNCADILPYVLNDQCFSRQILGTWDPEQSSLITWTTILVRQHHTINQFLRECGVYLISDWAILNDTKNEKLQRILTEFHSLTPSEILQAQQLLASYHAIYRQERLQQRAGGKKGKCTIPTTEQLEQIATLLQSKTGTTFSSHAVLTKLQKLASQLRQYRIHVRGGDLPKKPLDIDRLPDRLHPQTQDEDEEKAKEVKFLQLYRPEFLDCLKKALAIVTQLRGKQKKAEKAKNFLIGLQLFHCQNLSMTEIALHLGLRGQDAVTRLLNLKDFRADVRQQLLLMLRDRVLKLAENYTHPDKLKTLEQEIEIALEEQVDQIIKNAETQAQTPKNQRKTTIFSQQLCHYLDEINQNI